jgi:hypothetical protein
MNLESKQTAYQTTKLWTVTMLCAMKAYRSPSKAQLWVYNLPCFQQNLWFWCQNGGSGIRLCRRHICGGSELKSIFLNNTCNGNQRNCCVFAGDLFAVLFYFPYSELLGIRMKIQNEIDPTDQFNLLFNSMWKSFILDCQISVWIMNWHVYEFDSLLRNRFIELGI